MSLSIYNFIVRSAIGACIVLFFVVVPQISLAAEDADSDGLPDVDEVAIYNTDPAKPDTDGDDFKDGDEVRAGYSPRHREPAKLSTLDSDNDGAPDSWEIRLRLNILNPDTDGDGKLDGDEITNGYDPASNAGEKLDKHISVDLKTQVLAYAFNGVELERFKISSGVASMPTPKGDYAILDKVPSKNYGGTGYNFYYPNTKWNLHFTTRNLRYYIHGAYWHDNFGTPMSHGCINVRYANMERLYNFAEKGTTFSVS